MTVMDGHFDTADCEHYPALPDVEVANSERSLFYRGEVPVVYGHNRRSGRPHAGVGFSRHTA